VQCTPSLGSCTATLPNIGRFSCFLSAGHNEGSFLASPEFLYFYLVICLLVVANTVCFLLTGYFLARHWADVKSIRTSNSSDTIWSHVLVVFKIFLIMGNLLLNISYILSFLFLNESYCF
jgi:hypothetical protein